MSGLQRFITAQDRTSNGYKDALAEIRKGHKTSHWIWYIFPQITGLSDKPSDNTRLYALQSFQEAKAYLKHALLRQRLLEITQAAYTALATGKTKTILALLSSQIDVTKFQASMTLFLLAAYENGDTEAYQCFKAVLEKAYSAGALHLATLDEIETELSADLKEYQLSKEMPVNILSVVDRNEPQPAPTFPIPKHLPPILIADQSPFNQEDRALSTVLDQAFQFSLPERFFQWLYNLTHAKEKEFHRAEYQKALLINLKTPISVQSRGWLWLMGLKKMSQKIAQISRDQTRSMQTMPSLHYSDGAADTQASVGTCTVADSLVGAIDPQAVDPSLKKTGLRK